jgi:hypothetical protein
MHNRFRKPNPHRIVLIQRDGDEVSNDYAEGARIPRPERSGEQRQHKYASRQMQQQVAYKRMVRDFGPFDQSAGVDGAHYMKKNPFKAEGIACSNCVFYEGPRACEIVSGDIDPDAICKLWIIPGDLLKSNQANQDETENNKKPIAINYENRPAKPSSPSSDLMEKVLDSVRSLKELQDEISVEQKRTFID